MVAPGRRKARVQFRYRLGLTEHVFDGSTYQAVDGLAGDLRHLLEKAGLHAELDPRAVPRPPRFAAACARLGLDPERLALAGGEDYELLFTVRGDALRATGLSGRLDVAVSEIGQVVSAETAGADSASVGWRHF